MSSVDDMPIPSPPGVDENDTRQPEILGWASTMMVLSFFAVVLRFVSRYLVKNKPQLDDWLALASLPFAWMMCLISIYGVIYDHFGEHIGRSTYGSIRHYMIGLWVFDMVYGFAITLSKLSIMALWWRIFEVKSCHIVLGILAGAEISWLIGVTLTTIFSCVPVQGFWDLTIPSQCIVQSRFWMGSAIPNIVFDIILLVLPNFYIARLSISRSQKLGVSFIFTLGTFVTICSGLRLWQLIVYNSQVETDLPWATSTTAIWSFVEGNLSVVCCCLPSMRPLLRLLVHGRATTGRDYSGSRRSQFMSPRGSRNLSKRGSRVNPVPLKRISVGVSRKMEWWEKTENSTPRSAHTIHDEEQGRAGDVGDSWPLPSTLPTVETRIYAGERKPEKEAERPGSSSGAVRNAKHSRQNSRNRTLAWPGWIENLPKPSPAPHTWLQLEDTPDETSPAVSARPSHDRNAEAKDKTATAAASSSGGDADVSEMTYSTPSPGPRAVSPVGSSKGKQPDFHVV